MGQEIFDELKLEKYVGCRVFDEGRHDTIDFWHGYVESISSIFRTF